MDAEARLHIILDAYHGDAVSVIARLELREAGHAEGREDALEDALVTLEVVSQGDVPAPPEGRAWLMRLMGPNGVLDARTSDGSLRSLTWDGGNVTAVLDVGDVARTLGIGSSDAGTHVMHVLVARERREERGPDAASSAYGRAPG